MSTQYSPAVETARRYYNSDDADNFYYHVWGGEDIHVGIYTRSDEGIAEASRRTVKRMAGQLEQIDAAARVLDLGSGYGGSARYLASVYGCHVTALNLSETENARGREMVAAAGLDDRIDIVDGNFESIPLDDASCDIAWSQDAILHTGEREQVIREVSRVLRPGGEFILTDPMQADNCPAGVLQPVLDRIHLDSLASFAFYRQAATAARLEEVRIIDLTPQLARHYERVRDELIARRSALAGKVSDGYLERMLIGLDNWVDAGHKGYLAWGIMHFRKR